VRGEGSRTPYAVNFALRELNHLRACVTHVRMFIFALSLFVPGVSTEGDVLSLAVAKDGGYAVGMESGVVKVFSSAGKEEAKFIEQGRVTALEFSPDGTKLATGFQDDGCDVTTGVWTRDGKNIRYFDAFKRNSPSPKDPMRMYSFVTTYVLAWSPDGKLVAAEHGGHLNTGVRIWDMQGHLVSELGRNLKLKKGQRYPMAAGVKSLQFAPDAKSIMTSMDDGYVRVWNLNGSVKWEKSLSQRDTVLASFSSDGKRIVWGTAWQDRTIGSMDAATGKPGWSKRLPNYPTSVQSVGFAVLAVYGGAVGLASAGGFVPLVPPSEKIRFAQLDEARHLLVLVKESGEVVRRFHTCEG